MKKLFAILMVACLMLGVLSITSFATDDPAIPEPAADVVLRITALKKNDTIELVGDHKVMSDGWNAAMALAMNKQVMQQKEYTRVIVDIYADWTAVDTKFCSTGAGFDSNTIFVPSGVKVTFNLNNHTIDRALVESEANGEVICIASGADVIINDGTIKGGFSGNGAGGIHIHSKATVTLNNVHLTGNKVEDDDGAAIAVLGGAKLFMNGGSISGNLLRRTYSDFVGVYPYGSLYVENSTAILDKVTISDNATTMKYARGVAVYAENSTVTMKDCVVSNNATGEGEGERRDYADSIIAAYDSHLSIHNTEFTGNAKKGREDDLTRLFYMEDSTLIMEGGKITGNTANELFYAEDTDAKFKNVTIFDNNAKVLYVDNGNEQVDMNTCTIYHNEAAAGNVFVKTKGTLTMTDCTLNDTTFANPENVIFVKSNVAKEDALMGVNVLLEDGTSIFTKYYTNPVDGWNDAMTNTQLSNGYDRVIVDLYANWTAEGEAGEFSNSGVGFRMDAICIPEGARVTFNLNGHTIDRNLLAVDNPEYGGEVMYISSGANVIINDGTIKGGFSNDGAGGIHTNGANVTLNNVNVKENGVRSADGAGIAVSNKATLVMNGGSISNNVTYQNDDILLPGHAFGSLYVDNSVATLNKVTLDSNYTDDSYVRGLAIYAEDATVTVNECVVSNNATSKMGSNVVSIIYAEDSKLIFTNTNFTDNSQQGGFDVITRLFYLEDSSLTLDGGKITGNQADELFYVEESKANIKGVTITDNASVVYNIVNEVQVVTLTSCTLGNNAPVGNGAEIVVKTKNTLELNDCTMGDTTFENKSMVNGAGSLFGEGSIAVILALLALAASAFAIGLIVVKGKKNAAPAAANKQD